MSNIEQEFYHGDCGRLQAKDAFSIALKYAEILASDELQQIFFEINRNMCKGLITMMVDLSPRAALVLEASYGYELTKITTGIKTDLYELNFTCLHCNVR